MVWSELQAWHEVLNLWIWGKNLQQLWRPLALSWRNEWCNEGLTHFPGPSHYLGCTIPPTHPTTPVESQIPSTFWSSTKTFFFFLILLWCTFIAEAKPETTIFFLCRWGTEKWVKNHLHSRKNETASLFESIKIKKQPKKQPHKTFQFTLILNITHYLLTT